MNANAAARRNDAPLSDWRNRHSGATMIVCGCGRSLNDLPDPARWLTIGVNDVGRLFDPTYLVVVNPKSQFTGDRFRYVAQSRAQALFTQLEPRQLGCDHAGMVRFRLGRRGGTELDAPDTLPYTRNSPYVAVCLAAFMGAARIGLIGVDFTDHHFFGATGRHSLSRELAGIDREYGALASALRKRGIQLVNLSRESRLTTLPKAAPAAFLGAPAPDSTATPATTPPIPADAPPLAIVSYATTPVAGVPPILARCIAVRTPHRARCVWATSDYGNGVSFDSDVEWTRAPAEAASLIAAADVVVVHNGKVAPQHRALVAGKAVVTMAHNYLWNVDTRYVTRGMPGLVVGQYQATLPEFSGWTAVANPLPWWEPAFSPDPKPDVVTVCYTPSGKHERYPAGHRLYWHAKGYDTTMRVLEALARTHGVVLEVIRTDQIAHAESLAMKRRSHIVIDECVTGSYHRNTLEGLAAGCVVVNGLGGLAGVEDVFRRCAGGVDRLPCTPATLDTLEAVLRRLIESGAAALAAGGRANRAWMERHWDFGAQWESVWRPAVEAAIDRRPARRSAAARPAPDAPVIRAVPSLGTNVAAPESASVVVPHGGWERLPHLAATLAYLRRQDGVGEIIVAEMGTEPAARDIARDLADKHVFVHDAGPFARARALNAGSGLADFPYVLWHDNDLVGGHGFVTRALAEIGERRLDYLVPYTSVHYLSAADSAAVIDGSRAADSCAPVRVLYSGRRTPGCSGGAGVVTRAFLQKYGGLIEDFKGWGGEDNAWSAKVRMLGRPAPTRRADQRLYHLFHPASAGDPGQAPAAANPHYQDNVAALLRVQGVRSAKRFLELFPPLPPRPAAWDPTRGLFVAGHGDTAPIIHIESAARRAAAGGPVTAPASRSDRMTECRNVFACLVHDNVECVIDLVRNLRYMDPASTVLLYNGGRDPALLAGRFPFAEYGAVVHPHPRQMTWGRLHDFALDCMRFALDHLPFDALTIVDSDQLGARPGYSAFIGEFLRAHPQVGLAGSSAEIHPRHTRIGPLVAAYKEAELWRPYLSRFANGARAFGHWSFWPSTVVTADAARALTQLFDTDADLQHLVRRSQIWASEEVLFPMLTAALGYTVAANPCSYQYVKHRVSYSTRDLDRALTQPTAYWIHPVHRSSHDPLRAHLRARFNHYERPFRTGGPMAPDAAAATARPLFLAAPLLARMRAIEGWLEDDEADLLMAAAARALGDLPASHAVVEIGSYCGRSTIVLGAVAQAHNPEARVYAIDPHDGVVGALDQGLRAGSPTLARFQKNIADAGLQDVVVTIQQRSFDVAWNRPIALLFIDGLHDYANVARDFLHFERHVEQGGYVAFHDYADYYPGVKAFVNELLATPDYERVLHVRSMMLLRKRSAAAAADRASDARLERDAPAA